MPGFGQSHDAVSEKMVLTMRDGGRGGFEPPNNCATQARLHTGSGGNYVWLTNPTRTEQTTTISIDDERAQFHTARDIWGNLDLAVKGHGVTVTLASRDGAVTALR